jgi:putative ABC transport system substrate-binding protein
LPSCPTIQNRKWVRFVAIAVAIAMCGAGAEAQQQAKVFKIGWLTADSGRSTEEFVLKALRALGYVEGKNIFIEYRSAEGKLERMPGLADELVRLKVDVLVAIGTAYALVAKNATKTIPIVFTSGGDPVAVGLVDSLARPGGNVTGISTIAEELAGKRIELLKETVHKLSRVAVLWDPRGSASSAQQWKESQLPARELGLQLHSMQVSSADQLRAHSKKRLTRVVLLWL